MQTVTKLSAGQFTGALTIYQMADGLIQISNAYKGPGTIWCIITIIR
jgi:hypothetical protein